MLLLVALLAFGRRDVTASEAFAEGTGLLAAFEVPGPYKLASDVSTGGDLPWIVGFKVRAGDGRAYWLSIGAKDGRIDAAELEGWHSGAKAPRPSGAQPASEQAAKVEGALKAFFGRDLAMPSGGGEHGDANSFHADRITNGYALLPEESGSILVEVDARSGAPLLVRDMEPHPTYDFAKPKLDEKRATSLAERFLRVKPPKRPNQWYVERTTVIDAEIARLNAPGELEPRLGWHIVKGTGRARLAWRVPFVARWRTDTDTRTWRVDYPRRLYVDAVTGAVLDAPKFDADGMPRA